MKKYLVIVSVLLCVVVFVLSSAKDAGQNRVCYKNEVDFPVEDLRLAKKYGVEGVVSFMRLWAEQRQGTCFPTKDITLELQFIVQNYDKNMQGAALRTYIVNVRSATPYLRDMLKQFLW